MTVNSSTQDPLQKLDRESLVHPGPRAQGDREQGSLSFDPSPSASRQIGARTAALLPETVLGPDLEPPATE